MAETAIPDRPWLAHYPPHVPADITAELDRLPSLTEELLRFTRAFAERPAFVSLGSTITYGEWGEAAHRFAAFLVHRGVVPGDRVAIMLPNALQYPVCLLGALMAGAIVVNCNPLYTAPELARQLEDSGAVLLVVHAGFAHVAAAARDPSRLRTVVVTGIGDAMRFPRRPLINAMAARAARVPPHGMRDAIGWREAMRLGARALPGFRPHQARPEEIAFLQYTGGTTGVAKGAMLTHRNLLANLVQSRRWAGEHNLRHIKVVATFLPMYHIFALTVNAILFMSLGARNVLIPNPRDLKRALAQIAREPVDALTGVNALFHALATNPTFQARDHSRLRLAFAGGTAVHASVAQRWREVTGRHLLEGYGLTEASPIVTVNAIDLEHADAMTWNGTIGLPLPSTELRFVDAEGEDVAPGQPGELLVRGPQVMAGYWNRPDETARVMLDRGWLRTGDVGILQQDGCVRLVDRIKDMILVSGFNVYPTEIEEVATAFPGVREAAVVGVPDPVAGERVKLVVSADADLDIEALLRHCREHLTAYKVPRMVERRSEPLPKSPVGKVLRRELRG